MLISTPRFKGNNFYQTRPKIKVLLQKIAKSLSAGSFAPKPSHGFQQLGAPPQYQKSATLSLQTSGFAPD